MLWKRTISYIHRGNVLRIQPPLNIPPELLEKGYNIINEAIEDYKAGKISDDVLKYKSTW